MKVHVTRDSVAAGDDVDAPHTYCFEAKPTSRLLDVFKHLANNHYLAIVAGRGHSWQATIDGRIVATFLGNSMRPERRSLIPDHLKDLASGDDVHIHFRYKSAMY